MVKKVDKLVKKRWTKRSKLKKVVTKKVDKVVKKVDNVVKTQKGGLLVIKALDTGQSGHKDGQSGPKKGVQSAQKR